MRTTGAGLRQRIFGSNHGQAAMEFLLVTAIVVALTVILSVVLFTVREQGGRVLDLVASEFP
jgi:uncharacterized protein (UPF0333 family)